jgi:preprotein translocase SecE subunit
MGFLEFYKKGQGSKGRLLALVASFGLVAWGGHSLWVQLQGSTSLARPIVTVPRLGLSITWALIIAVVVVILGCAAVTWVLNRPRSVDLLVDTEAEMRRVSWPSRQEAWNSSLIVVITVIVLMALLFFYDFALNSILNLIFGAGGS